MAKELPPEVEAYINKRAGIEPEPADKPAANPTIPQDVSAYIEKRVEAAEKQTTGMGRALAQGVTFGFSDELEAALSAEKYSRAIKRIRAEQAEFAKKNPKTAFALEAVGSIPTSLVGGAALAKAGVKAIPVQGAIEGTVYGAGSGDTFEERVQMAAVGSLFGYGIGKVVDIATKPVTAGGLKTEKDLLADELLDPTGAGDARAIELAKAKQIFEEVDNPEFRRKPLSEAENVGELWDGLKTSVQRFYNQQMRGVSDNLWANVSPQIGALVQRANQQALLVMNKEFSELSKELIPVVKAINESDRAKGALLDYSAGNLTDPNLRRQLNTERARAKRSDFKSGQKTSDEIEQAIRNSEMEELQKILSTEISEDQFAVLRRYLEYSRRKNQRLNAQVFNAKFRNDINYLHTRLTKEEAKKLKEQRNLTDEQLEGLYNDPAFRERTRGSYMRGEDNAPNPANYENPIISDIQRLHRLEELAQLQSAFGVDVKRSGKKFLSPEDFMNELEFKFFEKGISPEGSRYARKQISDMIMGQEKTPHPLVQALNSIAYAVTLAGPMSAILNLSDIPLVGAKYGGKAVKEGLKEANPLMATPFKPPSQLDLKKMGLDNQVFGEFVSQLNELQGNQKGWMSKIASGSRKGADFLMKKSGFAAMDVVGKKGVMRGVLKSAADDADAGKLADNWGFYFNDAELKIISSQLKAHGTDYSKYTGKGKDLLEELMFAGLGQQQLISSAGRPAGWARNPNLRPLWALRGFVIKQQSLALREVVGNIKAGKPEKAAEFMGRYAMYGAGGYAVINESRQAVFGDGNFSANGMLRGYGDAWASLLTMNTLGLNDYQYGKIKEQGIFLTALQGSTPIAIDRPLDILSTTADVIDRKRPAQALLTEISPLISQSAGAVENISGLFGLESTEEVAREVRRKRNTNPN